MSQRTVADVMSRHFLVVDADMPVRSVTRMMAEHDLDSIPVVAEDGRVLGMVVGADILNRAMFPVASTLPRPRFRFGRHRAGQEPGYLTAKEVMNNDVATVSAHTSVWDVGRRLLRHGRTAMSVLDEEGRIIGIVYVRDVLGELLVADDRIRAVVCREVLDRLLWSEPHTVTADVHDGIVELEGKVPRRSLAATAVEVAGGLPGVAAVIDRLSYEEDDTPATDRAVETAGTAGTARTPGSGEDGHP